MRGTGCLPANLASNWQACEVVLRAVSSTETVDNRDISGILTDQGGSVSCASHVISSAIEMLGNPKPCILSIHALARLHSGWPLTEDHPVSLAAALSAVSGHGWMPETEWPFRVEDIPKPPPWGVAQRGFDRIGLLWHPITSERDIDAAVDARLPVAVGTLVSEEYKWWSTWDIWDGCESGEGHAVLIVGKDLDSYWVKGSWGLTHGELGFSRISKRHILDLERTHITAVVGQS